jgi:hypothetical protein
MNKKTVLLAVILGSLGADFKSIKSANFYSHVMAGFSAYSALDALKEKHFLIKITGGVMAYAATEISSTFLVNGNSPLTVSVPVIALAAHLLFENRFMAFNNCAKVSSIKDYQSNNAFTQIPGLLMCEQKSIPINDSSKKRSNQTNCVQNRIECDSIVVPYVDQSSFRRLCTSPVGIIPLAGILASITDNGFYTIMGLTAFLGGMYYAQEKTDGTLTFVSKNETSVNNLTHRVISRPGESLSDFTKRNYTLFEKKIEMVRFNGVGNKLGGKAL